MRKRYLVLNILLWAVVLQPIFSQNLESGNFEIQDTELENALRFLQSTPLEIEIHARIIGDDHVSVWHTQTREITVSGKSVSVTLEGQNLKVIAHLIPFLNEDQSMFLVAKGEVWIESSPGEEKKYYSTVKSLPITAGESVIFFPTGMLMDTEKQSVYTIELEIQVEPVE